MYYSMIDTLYSGELAPWELVPTPLKSKRAACAYETMSDGFCEGLSQKQREEFEAIMEKFSELWGCKNQDMFYTGFCMGARIMMEVMQFEER